MFTDARLIELLDAVAECEPCTNDAFARLIIPSDSPAWRKEPKRWRRGMRRGGAARSAAGGIAGRLRSNGYVEVDDESKIRLTLAGRAKRASASADRQTSGIQAGSSTAQHASIRSQISATAPARTNRQLAPPQWVQCSWAPAGVLWYDGAGRYWSYDAYTGWWRWPTAS